MTRHKSDPFTGKATTPLPPTERPPATRRATSMYDAETGYSQRTMRRVWRHLDNIPGRRIA